MLKIRRGKHIENFTIIPNALLRDDRLTYCARGLLSELLSRPADWETNADALSDRARRQRGDVVGEGRRAIRSAFKELEAAGYMVRTKEQADKGRFVTVLVVYDIPRSDRGAARATSASETSVGVTSASGTSSVSTDGRRTEEEDAGEEHSSALADAPAGQHAGKQDQRQAELKRLYAAADKLNDNDLRRLLLQFELKRPQKYREMRQQAIGQLQREDPPAVHSVRAVDLLSFDYALQHYSREGKQLPAWLIRFPLRSVS